MKPLINIQHVLLILLIAVSGCKDGIYEQYKTAVPVYMTYEDLRNAIKTESVQALRKPGKIYFKDKYIFINEYFKGVHVIDNTNPQNPKFVAFLNIPGNVDIAVKDSILFADSYIDIVAINIRDINNIKVSKRLLNILPYTIPANAYPISEPVNQTKGVVVGWQIKEITKEVNTNPVNYPRYYEWEKGMYYDYALLSNSSGSGSAASSGNNVGVGGSMARFSINSNALYIINQASITTFDITDLSIPQLITSKNVGWNIETLFLSDTTLFVGSQTGMHIFNVKDPFQLQYLSTYTHVRNCDPVVVDGNYAYATLRTGTDCGGSINCLDVVDISARANPRKLISYTMTNPHGLGVENNTLFVCDGADGLKVYSLSDVKKIKDNLIAHFGNIHAYDVIPLNGVLFMIGDNGFYQYDYTDLQHIKLLSEIKVMN